MHVSLNQKVAAQAVKYVGVREKGTNTDYGGPIDRWQNYWDMGRGTPIGPVPWCGCACSAWLRAVPGVTDVSHPSTWEIVQRAKRNGWVTTRPVPGALIVWPEQGGRHVEMVVEVIGPNLLATVGGNVSDAVARKVRSLDGATLVVSPELRNGRAEPVAYWLEDVAATPRMVGPWRTKAAREKAIASMQPAARANVRRIRTSRGKYAALVGPRRLYGPWPTASARSSARAVLQRRLGRTLRPFSNRTPARGGSAESLGKTD